MINLGEIVELSYFRYSLLTFKIVTYTFLLKTIHRDYVTLAAVRDITYTYGVAV